MHVLLSLVFYYSVVDNILNAVAVRRLTKSSNRIAFTDILDLTIAYILSALACFYIVFWNTDLSNGPLPHTNLFNTFEFYLDPIHARALILAILGLLFLGRLITKRKGSFFGRIHFSAIFVACSVYISYDILNYVSNNLHNFQFMYENLFNKLNNFIDFLNYFLPDILFSLIFIGTIFELILSFSFPTTKSLTVVLDKFPSDFKVITGFSGALDDFLTRKFHNRNNLLINQDIDYNALIMEICKEISLDIEDVKINSTNQHGDGIYAKLKDIRVNWGSDGIHAKLNNILCQQKQLKIKKILCISRQMVIIDDTIKLLIKNKKIRGIDDIMVIVSPPDLTLRDYDFSMKNAPSSLGDFINFKNYKAREHQRDYCRRLLRLDYFIKNYFLKAKLYYLGNVSFIIVEFDENNRKEIFFSIRDSGLLMRRVGLHSSEPHIIKYFENLFYSIWNGGIPSYEEKFKKIFEENT